jgi:hypothetical protein
MKKLLLYFSFLIFIPLVWATEFTLKAPFAVDDFEEGPVNLSIRVHSSNSILFPTNRISILGSGVQRILSLSPQLNVYGEGTINIDITDNAVITSIPIELTALPGTISNIKWTNNYPLYPTVITTTSPEVSISWTNPPQRLTTRPFVIKKSTIPLNEISKNPGFIYRTVGSTFSTNFVDTNVVMGTKYYYIINWVNNWVTNYVTTPMTTNYNFTMKVSPPIPLLFNGEDFGFFGTANTTYGIMIKPHMKNQVLWELLDTIVLSSDQFVLLDGSIYRNKPVHVRELD